MGWVVMVAGPVLIHRVLVEKVVDLIGEGWVQGWFLLVWVRGRRLGVEEG
jgi:hypothetical protein